jgi:hypothetical protein
MQYHQVRILCALRDKVWDADKSLTREQAMTLAPERMARLGSGSRDLFDIDGLDRPRSADRRAAAPQVHHDQACSLP